MSGTSCVNCPSGKYKSGSQTSCGYCSSCLSGKTSPSGSTSSSNCYINQCSAGKCLSGSSCVNCPSGKYKTGIQTGCNYCSSCTSGKTSPSGSTSSSNCYINQCSAGTYLSGSSCQNCASGTYKTNSATAQSNCQSCPSGKTSLPGSTASYHCFISSCAAGTTLNEAGDACTPCAAGTYKDDTTTDDCTNCPTHSTSPNYSDEITDCTADAGYYPEEILDENSVSYVANLYLSECILPNIESFAATTEAPTEAKCIEICENAASGSDICQWFYFRSYTNYCYYKTGAGFITTLDCDTSCYQGACTEYVVYGAQQGTGTVTVFSECPAHSTSLPGATSLLGCLCDAGYERSGDTCTPCAAGTYKDDITTDACTNCPTHSTSPNYSDEITDCTANAGYYALSDVVAGGSTNVLQVFSDVEYLLACDNGKQLIPDGDSQGETISFPSTSGVVLTSHLGNGLSNARTSCNADALCIGIYWRSSTQNVPGYPYSCNFPGCTTQQTVYTYYYYTVNTLDGMAPVQNWESTYCVYESGYSNWKVYAKRDIIILVITSCPTHSTSLAASTSLSDCLCNAGYERSGDTCTPCESGKYKAYGMSNDACVACTSAMAHTTSEGVGNTYCECQQGYTLIGEQCVICTSGDIQYYKTSVGNESCTACLPNHAILPGSIPNSVEKCKCIPGYFSASDSGSASCSPCAAGTYRQGLENGVHCTSCSTGATTIASGASDSTSCIPKAGYYKVGTNSVAQCPENTFRAYDNTAMSTYDISTCTPCPHMSSSSIGSTSLTSCTCAHERVEGIAGTACECVAGFYEFEESCAEQCSDDPIAGWYKLPGHLRTDTEDSTLQSTTLQQCAQYANDNNFEQIELSNDGSCKLWSDISLTTAVTPVMTVVKCHCPVRPDLASTHTCRKCPSNFFCPADHTIVACPWYSTTRVLPEGTNLARACGETASDPCQAIASSESSNGNRPPSNLIDGDTNPNDSSTMWHSLVPSGNAYTGKEWARIDLGQNFLVTGLHVWNRGNYNNGRLDQAYLRVGIDAFADWDEITANSELCGQLVAASATDDCYGNCLITCNEIGRYVYILQHESKLDAFAFMELQVFGAESGSTTLAQCQCEPGRILVDQSTVSYPHRGECQQCTAGTYSKDGGCKACPSNSNSLEGSASIDDCTANAGYFKIASSNTISSCPANSHSADGAFLQNHCLCNAGYTAQATSTTMRRLLDDFQCVACGHGKYKVEAGPSSCLDCPDYSSHSLTAETSAANCACNAGYTGDASTGTVDSCSACGVGTYKVNTGSEACIACNTFREFSTSPVQSVSSSACECIAGHFLQASSCSECAHGKYKGISGDQVCTDCPATGETQSTTDETGNINDSNCVCPSGYTGTADACAACVNGKYKTNSGSQACTECPTQTTQTSGTMTAQIYLASCKCNAGYTSGGVPISTDSNPCVACVSGKYKDTVSVEACTDCPATADYTTTSTQGQSICKCPVGYTGNPDSCSACETGKYKDSDGTEICTDCPPNSITSLTSSQSIDSCICKAGYKSLGDHNCEACTAGKFKAAVNDLTTCSSCLGDSHSTSAALLCTCNAGYTGADGDGSACQQCEDGKFKSASGSQACTNCPDTSQHSSIIPRNTQTDCLCNAGYHGDHTSTCTPCGNGQYKSTIGTDPCTDCLDSYHGETGALDVSACVCNAGFEGIAPGCTQCEAGKYSPGQAASRRRLLSLDTCGLIYDGYHEPLFEQWVNFNHGDNDGIFCRQINTGEATPTTTTTTSSDYASCVDDSHSEFVLLTCGPSCEAAGYITPDENECRNLLTGNSDSASVDIQSHTWPTCQQRAEGCTTTFINSKYYGYYFEGESGPPYDGTEHEDAFCPVSYPCGNDRGKGQLFNCVCQENTPAPPSTPNPCQEGQCEGSSGVCEDGPDYWREAIEDSSKDINWCKDRCDNHDASYSVPCYGFTYWTWTSKGRIFHECQIMLKEDIITEASSTSINARVSGEYTGYTYKVCPFAGTTCIDCPQYSDSPVGTDDIALCACNTGYTRSGNTCDKTCGPGYEGDELTEADACVECGAGKYKSTTGSGACINCPEDSTHTLQGQTSESSCICQQGHIPSTTEDAHCEACSDGDLKSGFNNFAGETVCYECHAATDGLTCSNILVEEVPAGMGVTNENIFECAAGTWNDGLYLTCQSCPTPSTNSGPAGATAESECYCAAGYERIDNVCQPCRVGAYKENVGAGVCQDCALGFTTFTDASNNRYNCVCAEEFGWNGSTCNACDSISSNHFKFIVGNVACISCPDNGVYTGADDTHDSLYCACNPGFKAGKTGKVVTSCIPCTDGSFQDSINKGGLCISCGANTISTAPRTANSDCACDTPQYMEVDGSCVNSCELGTYFSDADESCIECDGGNGIDATGTYKDEIADLLCSACTAPRLASLAGSDSPTNCQCPDGKVGIDPDKIVKISALGAYAGEETHALSSSSFNDDTKILHKITISSLTSTITLTRGTSTLKIMECDNNCPNEILLGDIRASISIIGSATLTTYSTQAVTMSYSSSFSTALTSQNLQEMQDQADRLAVQYDLHVGSFFYQTEYGFSDPTSNTICTECPPKISCSLIFI